MRTAATSLFTLASLFLFLAGPAAAQKTPSGARPQPRRGGGITAGATLGLTTGMFQPSAADDQYVNNYAIGFDMRVALWVRRFLGIKVGAGVDFFRGPEGPDGHPAAGSYGLADVALAFRTRPPRNGTTFGLDAGVATVFEPDYSYSYTEGNTIYVYPSIELPLTGGPFVEASVRRGGLVGWQVAYRHFFGSSDASTGRMTSRIMLGLSVQR